jgi:hypothetical protein
MAISRTRLLASLLAVTLPVALAANAWALPTGAAKKRKRTCKRLKGGRDLAPSRKVKLIRRRNGEGGTNLWGCVLPRGKVRLVASSTESDVDTSDYTVREVKGSAVLLDASNGNQYGGGSDTRVFRIRSGREYVIASSCRAILIGYCSPTVEDTSATRALVNRKGQAAAACSAAVSPEASAGPGRLAARASLLEHGAQHDADDHHDDRDEELEEAGRVHAVPNERTQREHERKHERRELPQTRRGVAEPEPG